MFNTHQPGRTPAIRIPSFFSQMHPSPFDWLFVGTAGRLPLCAGPSFHLFRPRNELLLPFNAIYIFRPPRCGLGSLHFPTQPPSSKILFAPKFGPYVAAFLLTSPLSSHPFVKLRISFLMEMCLLLNTRPLHCLRTSLPPAFDQKNRTVSPFSALRTPPGYSRFVSSQTLEFFHFPVDHMDFSPPPF